MFEHRNGSYAKRIAEEQTKLLNAVDNFMDIAGCARPIKTLNFLLTDHLERWIEGSIESSETTAVTERKQIFDAVLDMTSIIEFLVELQERNSSIGTLSERQKAETLNKKKE